MTRVRWERDSNRRLEDEDGTNARTVPSAAATQTVASPRQPPPLRPAAAFGAAGGQMWGRGKSIICQAFLCVGRTELNSTRKPSARPPSSSITDGCSRPSQGYISFSRCGHSPCFNSEVARLEEPPRFESTSVVYTVGRQVNNVPADGGGGVT